ncbi:MAG: hypothetical protein KDK38_08735 [Leptospiraceae bacterium]|nr:hypothetical protein [Leptospiraceae bacterium]
MKKQYIHEKKSSGEKESVAAGIWPGIQLYYPPVKFVPAQGRYENAEEAVMRLQNHACGSTADTILFDLEDGCHEKNLSRGFLERMLPEYREKIPGRVALRINQFGTEEYQRDLQSLELIGDYVNDVILPKAGELHGASEVQILAEKLEKINPKIRIQPIVEHPLSLKIADELMANPKVEHIIFGIHDFSRSMSIRLRPEVWFSQLYPFLCDLLLKARIAGCGVIGGVETLLPEGKISELLPDSDDPSEVRAAARKDPSLSVVLDHALSESDMGLTGKQVIHPQHIRVCRAAFLEEESELTRSWQIVEAANKADAWKGGAIRFENEMMDPPMFTKAMQRIIRQTVFKWREEPPTTIKEALEKLPSKVQKEVWPYKGELTLGVKK